MFTHDKVTAVARSGEVKTVAGAAALSPSGGSDTAVHGATKLEAGLNTAGGLNLSVSAYANSQYSYYLSGLLPATPDLPDSTSLAYFYRDMYLHDNTAGSCVDVQSVFPFSDWELRGLEDHETDIFNNALDRLNLHELLPQASICTLVDGFYTGSLIYDGAARNFMDILTHDALQCGVSSSPFNNVDPTVRVSVSGPTQRFLESTTDYAKQYIKSMPREFVDLLKEGSFVLDPVTTLFVARRGLTDRAYQSYLHRILPMYLIEKTMYRGTLVEANRRQRAMSHITAGDDIWTPTSEELSVLIQQFQMAEQDPLGGWISTRNAVQVQDLRPGGDFWKWTDMTDVMVAYKLRALGISEALLSGDASYAAAESAYSTFLETVNAYRTHITNAIFYRKLFPLIAISNGLYKDPTKKKDTNRLVDFLFNSNNRNNLKQPVLHWHKDLSAKAEDNMMDMLEKVETHGVPVPLKMWLAAAGVDKDTLIRDAKENKEIEMALRKYMGNDAVDRVQQNMENNNGNGNPDDNEFDGNDGGSDGDNGDGGGSDSGDSGSGDGGGSGRAPMPQVKPSSVSGGLQSRLPTSTSIHGPTGFAKGILNREFRNPEHFTTTVTGKKKHTVHNARGKVTDEHWQIAKIAAAAERDPNYAATLKAANKATLGRTRLNSF